MNVPHLLWSAFSLWDNLIHPDEPGVVPTTQEALTQCYCTQSSYTALSGVWSMPFNEVLT